MHERRADHRQALELRVGGDALGQLALIAAERGRPLRVALVVVFVRTLDGLDRGTQRPDRREVVGERARAVLRAARDEGEADAVLAERADALVRVGAARARTVTDVADPEVRQRALHGGEVAVRGVAVGQVDVDPDGGAEVGCRDGRRGRQRRVGALVPAARREQERGHAEQEQQGGGDRPRVAGAAACRRRSWVAGDGDRSRWSLRFGCSGTCRPRPVLTGAERAHSPPGTPGRPGPVLRTAVRCAEAHDHGRGADTDRHLPRRIQREHRSESAADLGAGDLLTEAN